MYNLCMPFLYLLYFHIAYILCAIIVYILYYTITDTLKTDLKGVQ